MALADVVHECQEPCAAQYQETTIQYLDDRIQALSAECVGELVKQGFRRSDLVLNHSWSYPSQNIVGIDMCITYSCYNIPSTQSYV